MAIDSVPRTLPLEAADEGRLVARAQLGEQPAREELARRFRQPVYLLALQIVGNKDDALDIAQDAMLRFFQHLGRLRPERSMRPWLFTIVRNRARDLWRRRSARPSESLGSDRPFQPACASCPRPRAEDRTPRARTAGVARDCGAVAKSPQIVVLRDFHDLAYSEVAEILEIPVGTVMSRLHAARAALGRVVKEGRDDG